jgi:tetratricopeptide (TPR) repeat protein
MLGNHKVKRMLGIFGVLLLISCSGPEAKKMKFFGKGKDLYEKGELVKAKLEFKNAVQIDPKFADAFRMLGMIALKEGNIKAAYGNFSKAVELEPGNRDAQYQLGKILLGVRETDKAMEKAELLLRQDPKNTDALQLKGAVMVARKDFDKARLYLEGLIGQGIKTPDVFLLLATTEAASGNAKGAENAVRRGIEANPKSVALNLTLAEICAREKRIDEAAAILKKVSEIEPANAGHKLTWRGSTGLQARNGKRLTS